MDIRKIFVFQQAISIKSGAETKKNRESPGEKLAKLGIETTYCSRAKKYSKNIETLLESKIFSSFFQTGS